MSNRCTGHCCRGFTLPYSPADVQRHAPNLTDGPFIADMVVPLYSGPYGEMPADMKAASDIPLDTAPDAVKHVYTCRHFDGANCTVYESRPEMCRNYPYGRTCEFPGCEWKEAREGHCSKYGVALSVLLAKPPAADPTEFPDCYVPGALLSPVLGHIIAGAFERFNGFSMRTSWAILEHVRSEIRRRDIRGRWGADGVAVCDVSAGPLPIWCWESEDGALLFGGRAPLRDETAENGTGADQ